MNIYNLTKNNVILQNKKFNMAVTRLSNIKSEMLVWAYERAGFNEERAVKAFPNLSYWLKGEKLPTVNQLQNFAKRFYVPFGYLFLQNIPTETIPFPMFRGEAGEMSHFDLNVYDTVNTIRSRQDWLEEYLMENDIEICKLPNSITLQTPIGEAVGILRSFLELEPRWAFSLARTDVAVGVLTERLEQIGVFVAYNGVVGNNTQRTLKVSECRGFALVNRVAPYIFVNSADSKSAQLFTLIHEVAHIMLGVSAGHAGEEVGAHDAHERYCDMLAAEFLVPAHVLCETWNGDIKKQSRLFKISEIVVARRAHDLGLLTDADYRKFWLEYSHRPVMEKKKGGGGDFYLTSVKRVGKLFAIHVRNAVNNRQLEYTEAYRLTGLSGNTYQHFMTNNI